MKRLVPLGAAGLLLLGAMAFAGQEGQQQAKTYSLVLQGAI